MGNSNDDSSPREVHPEKAEELASRLSSGLLDITHLRGKVSPGGPGAETSGRDGGRYTIQHFWSIAGPSRDELTRGFERLHSELSKKGWRITRYGHAHSLDRQLQIEAVHEKDGYSLLAELLINSASKNQAPNASKVDMIYFAVGSPTYRSPKGVDPNDY